MRVDIFDTAEDRRQVLPLRSDGLRVPWFQCLCKVLVLRLEVDLELGCTRRVCRLSCGLRLGWLDSSHFASCCHGAGTAGDRGVEGGLGSDPSSS